MMLPIADLQVSAEKSAEDALRTIVGAILYSQLGDTICFRCKNHRVRRRSPKAPRPAASNANEAGSGIAPAIMSVWLDGSVS